MRTAIAVASLAMAAQASAQERPAGAWPSTYSVFEKTMKELLAVTVVPARTEVVAGSATRVTGSLKLAPTFSGKTWGMAAIVVF